MTTFANPAAALLMSNLSAHHAHMLNLASNYLSNYVPPTVYHAPLIDANSAMALNKVTPVSILPQTQPMMMMQPSTYLGERLHSIPPSEIPVSDSDTSYSSSSATTTNTASLNMSSNSSSSGQSAQPVTQPKPTYKLLKCIGYGGYGRVYDGIRAHDGLPVVIKLIPKTSIVNWSATRYPTDSATVINNSLAMTGDFSNVSPLAPMAHLPFEIECMLRLRDTPGIIRIHDYFEETSCYVIVMEKLSRAMTLFDLANGRPFAFAQHTLRKMFIQLIRIIQGMMVKGIVHRDIKPENILVNLDDYSIKLIDFGSAAVNRPRGDAFREFQGTLECMPPEWILFGYYESEAATVWSLGVTFYFAVFGRYPYRSKAQIISGKFPLPYQNVATELLHFLDACFQMNPQKRVTLAQLLSTAWLKQRHEKNTTAH